MGAAWHPGQLLQVGFSGTRIPRDLAEDVAAGRVGGVIFFSRNVESPEQLRTAIGHLRELQPADAPLLISVDQEGGRVARLREPWATWPPARALGEHGDSGLAQEFGTALGRQLAREGFNLDFAPVVDVDSNPQNPVIGDRSLSARSQVVGQLGAAVIDGLQGASVAACAKHFPGHGDTDLDSHLDLPSLAHDRVRLEEVELPPFRAAIETGVASIMTAHVVFSAIDSKRPATMSPEAMALLRHELGYAGVVFTDDLEMGAVAKHYSVEQRILGPLRAGVDGLLICSQADMRAEAIRLLEGAADHLIEQAIGRIRELKARFPGQAPEDRLLPDPEHLELSSRIRGRLMSFYDDAWAVVRRVPKGTVVTYGQVATALGSPRAARQVGYAMAKVLMSDEPVPWHRVINAQGRISHRGDFERAQRQRELLEREGVEFDEHDRVDLGRFGHRFDSRYVGDFNPPTT